jgi:uncharacterized protein YjbJ (UPF0337 family)
MDQESDDIQQRITETRHDIEKTRASMTEKLELLEERVQDTVEGAKTTVEDIMENVKGTVDETVGTVKETVGDARSTVEDIVGNVKDTMDDTVTMVKQAFDLQYQMEQRPWLLLSGSVLVGYMLGCLGSRSTAAASTTTLKNPASMPDSLRSGYYATVPGAEQDDQLSEKAQSYTSGLWNSTLGQFKEEFATIKSAVIGALMSNVRDMVKQSMPQLAPQLEKAINSATTKLGAEPMDGEHPEDGTKHPADARPDHTLKAAKQSPTPSSEHQAHLTE